VPGKIQKTTDFSAQLNIRKKNEPQIAQIKTRKGIHLEGHEGHEEAKR